MRGRGGDSYEGDPHMEVTTGEKPIVIGTLGRHHARVSFSFSRFSLHWHDWRPRIVAGKLLESGRMGWWVEFSRLFEDYRFGWRGAGGISTSKKGGFENAIDVFSR